MFGFAVERIRLAVGDHAALVEIDHEQTRRRPRPPLLASHPLVRFTQLAHIRLRKTCQVAIDL